MKIRFLFLIIIFFFVADLQAQSDTIRYYFNKENYYKSALDSKSKNKKIRTFSIPLYCFNDSIKNYCCGKNLEPMIDFSQRPDLQTRFVIKGRNEIVFIQVLIDRFYEEVKQGNIKANKERFKKKSSFDEDFINQSHGNFYPFMILRGGAQKPTFYQKIEISFKNIKRSVKIATSQRFQYGKLWRFIDKHPDVNVFQITFVPGYWAIMNEKLIRLSDGKKIKISDANKYFCKSYAYCAVRLVYGLDSAYTVQQEECEKQKYSWQKCEECDTVNFKKIIIINDFIKD